MTCCPLKIFLLNEVNSCGYKRKKESIEHWFLGTEKGRAKQYFVPLHDMLVRCTTTVVTVKN